jgi:hypothetical protein
MLYSDAGVSGSSLLRTCDIHGILACIIQGPFDQH